MGDDNKQKTFFLTDEVEKCLRERIKIRFDTLLKARGIKWADAYNYIGLHKSYASLIRRGLIVPPLWMRVKIASFFKVDSTVIWQELCSAEKIKAELIRGENKISSLEPEIEGGKNGDN